MSADEFLIEVQPDFVARQARAQPIPAMADLLAVRLGQERFSWGRSSLRGGDEVRRAYIAALHAADAHDIGPLLTFAPS